MSDNKILLVYKYNNFNQNIKKFQNYLQSAVQE